MQGSGAAGHWTEQNKPPPAGCHSFRSSASKPRTRGRRRPRSSMLWTLQDPRRSKQGPSPLKGQSHIPPSPTSYHLLGNSVNTCLLLGDHFPRGKASGGLGFQEQLCSSHHHPRPLRRPPAGPPTTFHRLWALLSCLTGWADRALPQPWFSSSGKQRLARVASLVSVRTR